MKLTTFTLAATALAGTSLLAAHQVSAAPTVSSGNLQTYKSSKCLAVDALSNGAKVRVASCTSTAASQTFQFASSSSSKSNTLLQASASNLCLDLPNGRAYNGASVQIWACDPGNANQYWNRVQNNIRYGSTKYCLDVADGQARDFADGQMAQLWECHWSSANQRILGPAQVSDAPVPTLSSSTTPSTSATTSAKNSPTSTTESSTPTTTTSQASSTPKPTSSVGKPSLSSIFNPNGKRMLAWGYDNRRAGDISSGPKISSYHHWESGMIAQMNPKVAYIPTYWGHSKNSSWAAVQAELGNTVPVAVAGFNEPDVPSQANMDPATAAYSFYKDIDLAYGRRGANTITPAIAWDIDGWLVPFMNKCKSLGCEIDAIGLHIYLDLNGNVDAAVSEIENRVNKVYSKTGKPIVLSELGLTSKGGGSSAQIADFVAKASAYLDNSPLVAAWALSAVFAYGAGWDNYLNSNMAFFNSDGTMRDLAYKYMYTSY